MSNILHDLLQIMRQLEESPVLQAIAIYDCEATKEHVLQLDHKVSVIALVQGFGEEAGPVVRWFFKSNPEWMFQSDQEMFVPAVVTKRGTALVMSREAWEHFKAGTMVGVPAYPNISIGGPKVYDLNKEKV